MSSRPAVRAGGPAKNLIAKVLAALPSESSATPHPERALDEALGLQEEGHMLGNLLDLFPFPFLFREVSRWCLG